MASKSKKKQENEIDRNLSCEEMDSDELDGDLNLSDDDSNGTDKRQQFKSSRMQAAAPQENREQFAVEFDTNIFKVQLDCLQSRG